MATQWHICLWVTCGIIFFVAMFYALVQCFKRREIALLQFKTFKPDGVHECLICMRSSAEKGRSPAVKLLNCGHDTVCKSCIIEWQQVSSTCPFCRTNLEKIPLLPVVKPQPLTFIDEQQ